MHRHLFASAVFALAGWAASAEASQPPVPLDGAHPNPVGAFAAYLPESAGRLTLEQAVAAGRNGGFTPSREAAITFGIGAAPVWIRFTVVNGGETAVSRRISVETTWLDRVDFYVRHDGATITRHRFGDSLPGARLSEPTGDYGFEHAFPPGVSSVFVRVATPDPMVIPIRVESRRAAATRGTWLDHSYGFLYGYLIALMAYNATLFAGLRDRRYLLYSIYLALFVLANLSYTGHGLAWLWSAGTAWAQWSNPVLMMVCSSVGLLFATTFLDTRRYFPRIHRAVLGYIVAGLTLLCVLAAANLQSFGLALSFSFVFLFTLIMVGLGVVSVRAGVGAAGYFLCAAVCAVTGMIITSLAVCGVIPYNTWTFRAIDVGMLLDATLLALALTYQFRQARLEREHARELARIDPLTGLKNRRAFHDIAAPLWNVARRHGRDLAVILIDLDRFKRVNDTHGHTCGDNVLLAVTGVISGAVRNQDVVARWGGEEFVLLLPETRLGPATALAEHLRTAIAAHRIDHPVEGVAVTASFGVAASSGEESTLEELIEAADRCLLAAKAAGRSRVVHASAGASTPHPPHNPEFSKAP